MPSFSIEEVLQVTSGVMLLNPPRDRIRRLCTDSRLVRQGDLFIALKGPHFDGHEFVGEAIKRGAMGAIVHKVSRQKALAAVRVASSSRSRYQPFLVGVKDPLVAYQELAAYHRARFRIPVVAITGSNGKTTTKEMVARVLAERWRVLKTEGNLNNRLGLPQTLLRLTARHEVAVVEMGVDQAGQTTRLCEIARPTIGVITNIGSDHLEYFGSLEGSAQAKAELLARLPNDGTIVLNADDAYFDSLATRACCRVISFGFARHAHVRASHVALRRQGTAFRVSLPGRVRSKVMSLKVHGVHNVSNALAAVAVAHALGFPAGQLTQGLAKFRPVAMRSQVYRRNGMTVLHDCYNANPTSMMVAVDVLIELGSGKRTVAVLGDMLELGLNAAALHREIGTYVARQGVSHLVACGAFGRDLVEGARTAGMPSTCIDEVQNVSNAVQVLKNVLRRGDVVLLKASRGVEMERVLNVIFER